MARPATAGRLIVAAGGGSSTAVTASTERHDSEGAGTADALGEHAASSHGEQAADAAESRFLGHWYRSVAWETFARFGQAALQLPTFVLVSRLLAPEQVGALTLLSMVFTIVVTLYDSCLVTVVLAAEERPLGERVAESLVIGGVAGAAMATLATGFAAAFPAHVPGGPAALVALAPALLLTGLNSGHTAVVLRARLHRSLALTDIVTTVSGALVGLGLLVLTRTVWAVFAGFGAAQLAKCVMLARLPICRELRLQRSVDTRRALLRRLPSPTLAELLGQFSRNADYLAVTMVAGATSLAGYSRGFQLASFPSQLLGNAAGRVSMGAFAVRTAVATEMRRVAVASRSQAVLTTAAAIGLVLAGPWVLRTAAGSAYADAGIVVQLLALTIPMRTTTKLFNGIVLLREPRLVLLRVAVVAAAIFGGCLLVADRGIAWVAGAVAASAAVDLGVAAAGIRRAVGRNPWAALWPPLAGSALAAVLLLLMQ